MHQAASSHDIVLQFVVLSVLHLDICMNNICINNKKIKGRTLLLVAKNNVEGLKNWRRKILCCGFFFILPLKKYDIENIMNLWVMQVFLWTEAGFQPQDTASDSPSPLYLLY